ncbi:MAG: methyltransferase domain-containing protein [Planctomycetota bacterium]
MMIPKPAPWFGADKKRPYDYKGLRMKTDTHLHEQLEGLVRELVPVDAAVAGKPEVLDLGCGEGALSQRLFDLGYEVESADVDRAHFKAEGPGFTSVDFNDRAAVERFVDGFQGYPDLILAVEVVEHLRCPWDFVALCRRLCTEKTHLVITTPNVASWWSRFWFFLTGELWGFNPESWSDPGHVHAITPTEMRGILRENGFECLDVRAAGNLPVIWAYNWKRLLVSVLMLPCRLVMRGEKDGWVLCYHARRNS